MIESKDRSGWFGASDTSFIIGNRSTDTWRKWWLEKLGIRRSSFESAAMNAGTHWEHRILEHLGVPNMDRQIIIPEYRLRVNLDGDDEEIITEVKSHKAENPYTLPAAHRRQVLVQMWATGWRGRIADYGLTDDDYRNYFRKIDEERLHLSHIEPDEKFIEKYLRNLEELAEHLEKGEIPPEAI